MFKGVKKYYLRSGKLNIIKECNVKLFSTAKFHFEDLDQGYNPKSVEKEYFTRGNYFLPPLSNEKPFTLILPPPNITGTLHLGHALTATIQDVLIRWKRMRGVETVWVPGTDHAGIATQVVVEKRLWRESRKTRHDIGRRKFEEKVFEWKEEKARIIGQQLRRLGVSLDWNRECFTMDQRHSKAVQEAFIRLFESGYIYRGDYLVNWSCFLQSAISDIEVEQMEIKGPTRIPVPGYEKPVEFGLMYKFAYKFQDSDDEVIVATTRPETILGDVAVAVHPEDVRYKRFLGRDLWHPLRQKPIPLIADEFVDPRFGTGAVKITPAHDHNDFAVGKRHSLEMLQVIDEAGKLASSCGEFGGLKRYEARNSIIDKLAGMGLLRGTEKHRNIIPICSRSGDVVELLVRPQWFIKCDEMARGALKDVSDGLLDIQPKGFEKIWFDWLGNIRDWCVSRQLWWGHRVPAYFCHCETDGKNCWVAAENEETALEKASKKLEIQKEKLTIKRDEDVLDTWFSSALQPFAVFGWPQQTEDLTRYYPLSLMETGHDILFFWVARMAMLGKNLTGKLPFEKALLHGIICDSHGRKMSKSLGNVVTPEDVINGVSLEALETGSKTSYATGVLSEEELKRAIREQKKIFPQGIPECGSDALRFTLVSHNIKNHYINFDVQECHTNRLFCNKIWQSTKFVKLWCGHVSLHHKLTSIPIEHLKSMDQWILSRLTGTVSTVNDALENYNFHTATACLKEFLYYDFCDVYLESAKPGLRLIESLQSVGHCWTLLTCLDNGLRALAPFMPMLAQHLHQRLPLIENETRKMDFPQNLPWLNKNLEKSVETVLDVVKSIRRLKRIFNITSKQKTDIFLKGPIELSTRFRDDIKVLTSCQKVNIIETCDRFNSVNCVEDVAGEFVVYLPVSDEQRKTLELDVEKMEEKRLKLSKELERIKMKVESESYRSKVASEIKEVHSKRIAVLEDKLARISYVQSLIRS